MCFAIKDHKLYVLVPKFLVGHPDTHIKGAGLFKKLRGG